jgi:hypothetical protein
MHYNLNLYDPEEGAYGEEVRQMLQEELKQGHP